MKKILLIGIQSDVANKVFTGQSVMFDAAIEIFRKKYDVKVLNIIEKTRSRVIDYAFFVVKMLTLCIFNKFSLCYIQASQSKRGFYRDYIFILICRYFRIRVVTHQYGANYYQLLEDLSIKEKKHLVAMLDYVSKIIVEGICMKEQFSFYNNYDKKVVVIPNCLPIEGKHCMIPKKYDESKPFVLLYLSNMIYTKGYFDVLKAVDMLVNRERMNVRCIFSGRFMRSSDDSRIKENSQESFEEYIKVHNLGNRILYFKGLYGDDKDYYFNLANAFILPTYYINEGQPISIIEAMAYGCVPIVTNYRHIPMMVDNKNGCFVQPKSPESICSTIKFLMNNPKDYESKSFASVEDYKSKFRFEIFSSKLLAEIKDIIS